MSELDEELAHYNTLKFLVQHAKKRALDANPKDEYVLKLCIPELDKKRTDRKDYRRKLINKYFDSIEKALFDQYLFRLVAVFERLAFKRLRAAVGAAHTTVKNHYPTASPFSRAVEHLVKNVDDDLTNPADIEKLIAKYSQPASTILHELREHRNWIAHTRREVGQKSRFSCIDQIHKELKELLKGIDAKKE